MKTLLKFFSKKFPESTPGHIAMRFAIGAAYGNLELYGYLGVGSMIFSTFKTEVRKWLTQRKSANLVIKK